MRNYVSLCNIIIMCNNNNKGLYTKWDLFKECKVSFTLKKSINSLYFIIKDKNHTMISTDIEKAFNI